MMAMKVLIIIITLLAVTANRVSVGDVIRPIQSTAEEDVHVIKLQLEDVIRPTAEDDTQHVIEKRFDLEKINPRFRLDNYQVLESAGTVQDLVCIIAGGDRRFLSVFSAGGPPERCFRFPCPLAAEGEDYVAIRKLEFFLKPGNVVCLNVTVIDDTVIDGREFFLLALRDLSTGEVIATTVVTINDNDDPSLLRANQLVSEGAGVVPVCVLGGIEPMPVKMEVLLTSSASSQAPGVDFTVIDNSEVVVNPGQMACFRFNIADDDLDEGIEYVQLVFTQGNDANGTFSLPGTIRILDNDFSPNFERKVYSAEENDSFVEVCVTFRADASTTVSAYLSTVDYSAIGLQDYLFYESEFNISGGDRVCHDIQLVNDTTPELTEHFRIFITASNSVTAPRNSLVYIYDDDVLDFNTPNRRYFTLEGNIQFPICVSLLSGSTNGLTRGYIYTQPLSAKVDKDFRSIDRSFVLNNTNRMCFILPILQDNFPEVDEELKVRLLTISGGFIVSSVTATVTIRDDDATPCDTLVPPTNGRITYSNGNIPGSRAFYGCDSTFRLVGSYQRVCQVDGTWTGTEPTCEVL